MKESPEIIKGNCYSDERGSLYYNNDFDASEVKRIYFIENKDIGFKRGWQGHKIEQRWFSVVQGSFKISVIAIDDWNIPSDDLVGEDFVLSALMMDVLHVPKGHVTCIQALEDASRLMALSDYSLGEVNDEYRFDTNYFK
jgi:hypothetical protein